jgi:arginyl-tRNA--protein-N-Asp/Glu arginylyltransferase
MFAKSLSPQTLSAEELDDYLFRGWFRMGQTIFTTNFLSFKSEFYSALWLRIDLHRFSPDSTQLKLFKLNARFRTEINVANITPVQEALYEKYKNSISFEASTSLKTLLFGRSPYKIYNTFEVDVFDGDTLIATGFFDTGKNTAAGITSFYDPAYKKYSLGKYVIYQKINFCKTYGLRYFYPGYFVPGYSFFDYKLSIGKPALEYLDLRSGLWLPIERFSPAQHPLRIMENKLSGLQHLLLKSQVESKILKYEYFDANLVPGLTEAELLDFPVILCCHQLERDGLVSLVVYDVRDDLYKLIACVSVWSSESPNSPEGFYSSHLLKAIQEISSSGTAEQMAQTLMMEIKRNIRPDSGSIYVSS